MLRLFGYFVGVLAVLWVLRLTLGWVPLLGPLLRVPILGFWVAAILVSVLASRATAGAVDRRRVRSLMRQLGAVDTPHNKGKLGSLFLNQRRPGKAVPLLAAAAEGEPEEAEWHFRHGQALLRTGRVEEALEVLDRALTLDEEHGYGTAMLSAAEAALRSGDAEASLHCVQRFEVNHGPSPESAYRRGLALRSLRRGEEARAALGEVAGLARSQVKFQRKSAAMWQARALLARLTT